MVEEWTIAVSHASAWVQHYVTNAGDRPPKDLLRIRYRHHVNQHRGDVGGPTAAEEQSSVRNLCIIDSMVWLA